MFLGEGGCKAGEPRSCREWWSEYTTDVISEMTKVLHQLSWGIQANLKEEVGVLDEIISGLGICGIPGREVSQTLAEALGENDPNDKAKALIDFWDALTTKQKTIQLASGRHLRGILEVLNSQETYAMVAHDIDGQDSMTAVVHTNGLVGDNKCARRDRTVVVDTDKSDIVNNSIGFLKSRQGCALPIISTETAMKLGFRAILPMTGVILSSIEGAYNGVKTATSTSMTIEAAGVIELDETYRGCYVAMCMTDGQIARHMNDRTRALLEVASRPSGTGLRTTREQVAGANGILRTRGKGRCECVGVALQMLAVVGKDSVWTGSSEANGIDEGVEALAAAEDDFLAHYETYLTSGVATDSFCCNCHVSCGCWIPIQCCCCACTAAMLHTHCYCSIYIPGGAGWPN